MAAMHAHFLGWRDDLGLQDLSRRWLFFAPETIAPELEAADVPGPIAVAHQGWGLLPERAPRLHDLVTVGAPRPRRAGDALRATPLTFVGGRLEARQRRPPPRRPDRSCSTGPTPVRRRRAGT